MDLSVIIPARNEMWLRHTVADVCANMRGETEVIVVLDGAWPPPGSELPQHPRVQVLYTPTPIGQRAATNLGARISTARYVMKLDGHCAVAEGFDVALMTAAEQLGPDVTQIPAQKNLHIWSWVCDKCGRSDYQTPPLTACLGCGGPVRQEIVWKPRGGTTTTAWYFDAQPKFGYWGAAAKAQQGDICDVMTSLGACFFMERERFWQLGGLDESYGIWGSFGIEVACKSWLSGGRHVVNKVTWFAHFFRVGGHGFPYPLSGSQQAAALKRARDVWFNDAWPGQVRPLRWLVEKFWPVPGWTQADLEALPKTLPAKGPAVKRAPTKGIAYYTDNRCPEPIAETVRTQLARVAPGPIACVSLAPVDWPEAAVRQVLTLERGALSMFRQILAALEALDTEYAFLCEHDVLYHPSHFDFVPPLDDVYYYNLNTTKVDAATGRAVSYITKQTSQLCANRELLIAHYRQRIAIVERDGFSRRQGFEPGSHRRNERIDDVPSDVWRSPFPNLDIRHTTNLTASRWSPSQFRDQRNCQEWTEHTAAPGWPAWQGRTFTDVLQEVAGGVLLPTDLALI